MRILRDFDASIYKSRQTCVGTVPTKELLASRCWIHNPARKKAEDYKYIPNPNAAVRYAEFYDRKTGSALRFEGPKEVQVWKGTTKDVLLYIGYSGAEYMFTNNDVEEYFRTNFQWAADQIVPVRMKLCVDVIDF